MTKKCTFTVFKYEQNKLRLYISEHLIYYTIITAQITKHNILNKYLEKGSS